MKTKVLLLIFLATLSLNGFAQYNTQENMKWAFGSGAGLDFSSGSPVAITTSMTSGEGCAMVCDATGNLLFYTEGTKVWDRTGAVMPSGSSIVSFFTSSSTQGSLIAPVASNPNQYYVFSLEDYAGSSTYCRMDYCKVDMTLNGGLGDVVASSIGTVVTNQLAEKMMLVSGNACNLWLVTHRKDSTVFLAYSISGGGIAAPVSTNIGTFTGTDSYTIGVLKISPDRQHIISQVYPTGGAQGTELYDFDANTGNVSNCRVLMTGSPQYGADFSPNSSRVYCQEWGGQVDQYDITGGTAAAIMATRTTIISTSTYSDIKLGPDGKLYIRANAGATFLDAIPNPNVAGTGCGYSTSAVTLAGGSSVTLGLPNIYVKVSGGGDTSIKTINMNVCLHPTGVTITADTTGSIYYWNIGATTSSITATSLGDYWVIINNNCRVNIDTFHVTGTVFSIESNAYDTSLCANSAGIDLNAVSGYTNYMWQDGTTNMTSHVNTPGTYYVSYDSYCKQHIDTFHVGLQSLSFSLGADVSVCSNYEIIAPLSGSDLAYKWFDGSIGNSYSASRTGDYSLTITKGSCEAKDTIHVTFDRLSQNIPDTFICKETEFSIDLNCIRSPGVNVLWNDGSTNPVKTVKDSGTYWVYVSKGDCQILDTVRIVTGHCNCWHNVPSAFTPNGDGLNDIVCPKIQPGCTISSYQFSVYDRWGELVFTSDVPGWGWDGMYKGQPADLGVYMYSLTLFKGVYDKTASESGSITLIR